MDQNDAPEMGNDVFPTLPVSLEVKPGDTKQAEYAACCAE